MLTGVLLHVVAAAGRVNAAVNSGSRRDRCGSEMEDAAIFFVRDVDNRNFPVAGERELSRVMDLATASRIERRAVQHHGVPAVTLERLDHAGVEVVEERIVVVETLGHTKPAVST